MIKKIWKAGLLPLLLLSLIIVAGCGRTRIPAGNFSFAFMTDIHLEPEKNAEQGFEKAIESVNEHKPEFVITGGDLIMDAMGQPFSRADSLYRLYLGLVKKFNMVVYNTLGNHDIYGIYSTSGADHSGPEFGEKMFEARIGKSYYAFEHKGWKFFILNTVEDGGNDRYIGKIDDAQLVWIREELARTGKKTPLAISSHMPFMISDSVVYTASPVKGRISPAISNAKEVLDLFRDYNLKLVLQGHLHKVEDVVGGGVHFITGGAVSGSKWEGPIGKFEEGYVLVNVKGEDFTWNYIDYGWEAGNGTK